jgi:hypothetical protein
MAGSKGIVSVGLVAFVLAAMNACSGGTGLRGRLGGGQGGAGIGGGAGGSGGAHVQATFQATLNRQLDMLFMIDNSASMLPLQAKFLQQFPVFMNILKMLPTGDGTMMGLPDLHVAVISSDTGPGKYDLSERHCAFRGDGGAFQTLPRGSCTTAPLSLGQTFLATSMSQAVKNYTGDITDAFACIAALGDQGCGFEGQLKSVRWALDPLNVPAGNEGFLRPDAYLAVILLTNEDDCSIPDDSDLVDPTATGVSLYGPLASYRCNEFGHLCEIGGTLQAPSRTFAMNNLAGCTSNETASGKLTKVAEEITFLKSLKSDPNRIFVAAITGPAVPYSVGPDAQGVQSVLHSCTQNAGEYGDPAVRIEQWVRGFGDHGLAQSICAISFAPALAQIAGQLGRLLGPQCIPDNLVDIDLATPGIQPDCQVTDQYVNDQGQTVRIPLPSCATTGGTPPCWSIDVDALKCPGASLLLNVHRSPGGLLPNGLTTSLSCAECPSGPPSPACP